MKGIHPEYLVETKSTPVSRIINKMLDTNGPQTKESLDREIKELTKKEKYIVQFETDVYKKNRKIFPFKIDNLTEVNQDNDLTSIRLMAFHDMRRAIIEKEMPLFRVGKDFMKVMSSIRKHVPVGQICKKYHSIYIHTPDFIIGDQGYNGAYVLPFVGDEYTRKWVMMFLTPNDEYSIMRTAFQCSATKDGLIDFFKFEEKGSLFANHEAQQMSEATRAALAGILNCAIYANSQDPDIELMRPLKTYSKKDLETMPSLKKENLCTLPVRLLNWEYHTGRQYSIGEGSVTGHWRWQPCGPEKKDVKLIWIDEHVRHYDQQTAQGNP